MVLRNCETMIKLVSKHCAFQILLKERLLKRQWSILEFVTEAPVDTYLDIF